MSDSNSSPKRMIQTELQGLELIELGHDDAPVYYQVVDRNRDHLTLHGDYQDLKHATFTTVMRSLSDPTDENERFGIWLYGELVGRVDLSPRASDHYVIGYWLDSDHTGNGYATMACSALLQYGRDSLGATHIYAGVTKGNRASERVLERLGFERIEDRGHYSLFRASSQQQA